MSTSKTDCYFLSVTGVCYQTPACSEEPLPRGPHTKEAKPQNEVLAKSTADQIAKEFGVGKSTVERAVRSEKLREELDSLTPEDRARVEKERAEKRAKKMMPKEFRVGEARREVLSKR